MKYRSICEIKINGVQIHMGELTGTVLATMLNHVNHNGKYYSYNYCTIGRTLGLKNKNLFRAGWENN